LVSVNVATLFNNCVTGVFQRSLTFVSSRNRFFNSKIMKTKKLLLALSIVTVAVFSSCKSEGGTTNVDNPVPIPVQNISQVAISLDGLSNFAIIAGSAITSTGATTVTGDMGLSPGTSCGGFPPGILTGTLQINTNLAIQGKLDLTAAYNDAAGRVSSEIVTLSGNIGGLTLTPGLYKTTSSLAISSGDLTFDARGNSNAVFIIQIASSFTTTSGRKVFLKGNASASNIYWMIGSSATFGTTSVMKGTVMAMQSITMNTGATLNGRALTRIGGITMAGNTIVKE